MKRFEDYCNQSQIFNLQSIKDESVIIIDSTDIKIQRSKKKVYSVNYQIIISYKSNKIIDIKIRHSTLIRTQ